MLRAGASSPPVTQLTYLGPVTSVRRQPAGTRTAGVAEGGRFASKPVPIITDTDVVGFGTNVVGSVNDWDQRVVWMGGFETTFTRTVETLSNGDEVATVTTDCDDPSMLLLARKGDVDYWSRDIWTRKRKDRQMWCSDIVRRMLQEGLVANDGTEGINTAVTAASSATTGKWREEPHTLTGVVAQIRGLRLLQSMAGHNPRWWTKFGGHRLPDINNELLGACFRDVYKMYEPMPRPPWDDQGPWSPVSAAGHVTDKYGYDLFVGAHGDLGWRALTETDHHGLSPLKADVRSDNALLHRAEMITAAALYDETAAQQLTTGLFDGVRRHHRSQIQQKMLRVFADQLDPDDYRWTTEQQNRLRGFSATIEALEP